ncbi:hypothetical protein [Bosea thiooxidans]
MSDMSIGMLVLFVLYAAFAAYVHEPDRRPRRDAFRAGSRPSPWR